MNSFIAAAEAFMLAQAGQQQVAAALAAGAQHLVRRWLDRIRRIVPSDSAGQG